MKSAIVVLMLLFILPGCSNTLIPGGAINGNPTAEEMLANNSDADIFVMDGYVFSNAEHIEWVRQQEYELGEQVGEITKQTTDSWRFEEGTASKLPVGTKIFETDAPFYIAVVDDEEIAYIKLIEGWEPERRINALIKKEKGVQNRLYFLRWMLGGRWTTYIISSDVKLIIAETAKFNRKSPIYSRKEATQKVE